MRNFIDMICETTDLRPEIDPKKIASAQAEGFDTSAIWYHGTRSKGKFTKFKLPSRSRNGAELGSGVYVTSYVGTANVWAQGNGAILACVLREGKLIEMSNMQYSQLWDSGPDRDPKWANPLWNDAYRGYCLSMAGFESTPGANDACLPYREFAEQINKGKISIASCLSQIGYIGATSRYSQIKGQAVIWNPEDVRIVGKSTGFEGYYHDED